MPAERPPARERAIWAVLVLVLAGVVALGVRELKRGPRGPELPVLGTVPAFSLVERSGRVVTAGELGGAPWVADFIFTRCAGICPVLSTGFARLQDRLPARTRLVSFSVDPVHDTPEVLRLYADGYGARPDRWLFLTGERDSLHRLIRDGFKLSVAEAEPGANLPAGELITHSDRWVLVDSELRVRAYYHGTEPDAADRLLADLAGLGRDR